MIAANGGGPGMMAASGGGPGMMAASGGQSIMAAGGGAMAAAGGGGMLSAGGHDTVVGQTFHRPPQANNPFGNLCCGLAMIPLCCIAIMWNEHNLVINKATAALVKGAVDVPTASRGMA